MAKLEIERVKLENIFNLLLASLEANNIDEVITQLISFHQFIIETIPSAFKSPLFNYENLSNELQKKYKGIQKPCTPNALRNGAILMELIQQDFEKLVETNDKVLIRSYQIIRTMFKLFAHINNTDFFKANIDLNKDVAPLVGKIKITHLVRPTFYTLVYDYSLELAKRIPPSFLFWQQPNTTKTQEKNNQIDSSQPAP